MTEFGLSFDQGHRILPLDLAHVYRSVGATHIRYLVQWPEFEPERGRYDFSFMDASIANARQAGLDVCLNPYFIPKWATGDFDCMSGYDNACNKGSRPLTEEEAPRCYDLQVVDDGAVYRMGMALADRYGQSIYKWGVFNEPGVRDYWLTTRDDTAQSAIERWYEQIAVPFVGGLRSAIPGAHTVAQFDAFCDYAHCVEIDTAPVLSEIGIHPYSDVAATPSTRRVLHTYDEVTGALSGSGDIDATTDAVVVKTKDEFMARLAPHLAGREVSITEIQGCDPIQLMARAGMSVTEFNPARYVDQHLEWYHDQGGKLDLRIVSRSGKWELTEEGKELVQRLSVPRRRHSAENL